MLLKLKVDTSAGRQHTSRKTSGRRTWKRSDLKTREGLSSESMDCRDERWINELTLETPFCRQLVGLLSSSRDPLVLAVAVHDIGQFIKYGDDGARK